MQSQKQSTPPINESIDPPTETGNVERLSKACAVTNEIEANAKAAGDWRLERLINRLPHRIGSTIRFVRQPTSRWLRIPTAVLLTVGGGLWFLPIGLALLADDVRPLRSLRSRTLDWVERHRPDWLANGCRK